MVIYLDILTNDGGDNLLYVNGESYQDIDDTWVDCLDNLQELFGDNVKVKFHKTSKPRYEFEDKLTEYKDATTIWKSIDVADINLYLNEVDIRWQYDNKTMLFKAGDSLPNTIPFEMLTNGEWYIRL